MIRSHWRIVESRWAMTIRVHFIRSSDSETCFCVTLSRADVASSNIRILGFGAIARAISSRCRCPPEMPPDPSEIIVCIPIGIRRMSSAMPASSAASQASSSVSHGAEIVMLEKMSPLNIFPFCMTAPIRRRRDFRSSRERSRPS